MDDQETGELVALLYDAYKRVLAHQQRLETRAATKMRVARHRTNAPTRMDTQSDSDPRERIGA